MISRLIGHTTLEMEKAIDKGLNKMNCIHRVRNRMEAFFDKYKDEYIYFATFTFNEEHYMPDIRMFTQYLRRHDLIYCLYPDYGEDKQRYHLHGFVVVPYKLNTKEKRTCKGNYNYTSDYFNLYGFNKLIECHGVEKAMLKYCFKYSVKFNDQLEKKYERLLTNDKKKKKFFHNCVDFSTTEIYN